MAMSAEGAVQQNPGQVDIALSEFDLIDAHRYFSNR
jgi:hypothetical protein